MLASVLLCFVIAVAIVFLACFEVAMLRDASGRKVAYLLRAVDVDMRLDSGSAVTHRRQRIRMMQRPTRALIAMPIAPPTRSKRRRG